MAFQPNWVEPASSQYRQLQAAAEESLANRRRKRAKAGKAEGLFKQVQKCVSLLLENPRHPGLKTHKFDSLEHPFKKGYPVFDAYVRNATPGAYRSFWCYGLSKGELTYIAITPHP